MTFEMALGFDGDNMYFLMEINNLSDSKFSLFRKNPSLDTFLFSDNDHHH